MRRYWGLALALAIIFVFRAPARAQMMGGGGGGNLTEEQQKAIQKFINMANDRLKHRFVAVIEKVAHSPASPAKGQAVTVKATVSQPKGAVDKISTVELFYCVNGGAWKGPVKMTPDGAKKVWTGTIPALTQAGTVAYYVAVTDSDGNVTVDLPCKVTDKWPAFMDACMIPISMTGKKMDDASTKVENDLDIWEIRAGFDDTYFYLMQSVEGKINQGSMSPMKVNGYMALFMKTSDIQKLDNVMTLMGADQSGKDKDKNKDLARMVMYAPLGKAISKDAPACALIGGGGNFQKPNTADITCKADGPDLMFRIKRSALGSAYTNGFMLVGAMTGFTTSAASMIPTMREFAKFSAIKFSQHTFKVK